MREIIIYSNILNETEYLRSLTLKGIDSFGTKVFNFDSLIRETAIRSGYDFNKQLAHNTDIEYFLSELTKDDDRFRTYEDVVHLAKSLHDLRLQLTSQNELEEFREKVVKNFKHDNNIKLLDLYFEKYLDYLEENKFTDSIQLGRKLIKQGIKKFDCLNYYSFNLTPFEKQFLEGISYETKQLDLFNVFGIKKDDDCLIKHINPYYGERSEIEGVIDDICRNKYPLDECLIISASADPYSFLAYDYSETFNIPLTSEIGFPIHTSRAFKFYQLLRDLKDVNCFDVNGYLRLFRSGLFDLSIFFNDLGNEYVEATAKTLGRLKISFDREYNEGKLNLLNTMPSKYLHGFIKTYTHKLDIDVILTCVTKITNCFSEGLDHVVYTAFKFSNDTLNKNKEKDVLDVIYKELSNGKNWTPKYSSSYLEKMDLASIHKKCFSSGKIHFTDIKSGFSTIRKYVYFIGLSADNFPGKPSEDYLLPDVAYDKLGVNKASLLDQRLNKAMFDELIALFNSFGSEIHLSFSCQNIKDVKAVNPSSEIFKYADKLSLVDEKYSLKDLINSAAYYQNDVRKIKTLLSEYKAGKKINTETINYGDLSDKRDLMSLSISPSNLGDFYQCPFKFYYKSIIGLRDEITYDAFKPLGGTTYGSIFHFCLETARKEKKDISIVAYDIIDYYLKFDSSRGNEFSSIEEFVANCKKAYEKYLSWNFLQEEYFIDSTLKGFHFRGACDAIIEKDGKKYILDYKTSKNVIHKEKDVLTCSQGFAYALMYEEKTGETIDGVIFYYPRAEKEVVVELTKDVRDIFYTFLETLKEACVKKEFLSKPSRSACMYCVFSQLCDQQEEGDD